MKTFRRIMAVMLTLVLSLSVLGVTAMAATTDIDSGATGSITVHKYEYNGDKGPNGDGTTNVTISSDAKPLEGVTFTAYKVMDAAGVIAYYKGDTDSAVTVSNYVDGNAIKSGVTIGSSIEQTTGTDGTATFSGLDVGMYVIIETEAPEKVTVTEDPFLVSIPMTNPNDAEWMYDVHVYPKNSTSVGTVTVQKFGEDGTTALNGVKFTLMKGDKYVGYDEDNGWTYDNTVKTEWTITNGQIQFSDLAHGTYKLIETSTTEGYILDNRPIEFTIDTEGNVTCVSDRGTVSVDGSGNAALTIKITNEKPDITKDITEGQNTAGVGDTVKFELTVEIPQNITAMKTFTVKDAPTDLKVDTTTIAVKDGSNTVTGCYTPSDDGNGFTLTFNPSAMTAYAGKTLTITYDATVLASAATDNSATNKATLTYTDKLVPDGETPDPTHDDDDTEETKNFKISITKYKDSATSGNEAAGVEFELYSDANLTTKVGVTGTDGSYVVTKETGANTTLKTGTGGKLEVSGLAAGTYYLKETKAPDGYNLLSDEIEIKLNIADESDLIFTKDIINKVGFTLPRTGGLGTLMFILIGAVLIGGGIYLLAVPSKKRSV